MRKTIDCWSITEWLASDRKLSMAGSGGVPASVVATSRSVLAAALLLAAGGCGRAPTTSAALTVRGRIARPLVVRKGTFVRRVLLTGELKAVHASDIIVPRTPQWQVTIRWMEADGAEVKAGQKIVEFDNSTFTSNLEQKRLGAHKARTELVQQEAQNEATLADKEIDLERKRVAFEKARIDADVPPELLAHRDWQEHQLALERAQVDFDKAGADLAAVRRGCAADIAVKQLALEKVERDLGAAETAIAALVVTAPRDGFLQVGEHPWLGRKFEIGDSVWVGLSVMRIPELAEMQVEAALADVDDGTIAVGNRATCSVDAFPDRSFAGTVSAIAPIAQEPARASLRRSFRVAVTLGQTDAALVRPGMAAKVEVEAEHIDNALVAPRAALDLSAPAARARLADGSWRPVRIARCSTQECVLVAGLDVGARLRPVAEAAR